MHASTKTVHEIEENLKKSFQLLKTLRDEIRVELHLGSMEAAQKWDSLEKQLASIQNFVRNATSESRQAVGSTVKTFKLLQGSLRKASRQPEVEP
jgi:hypothetical protein